MDQIISSKAHRDPWNKGKLVGQKSPLKLKDIWAMRIIQSRRGTRERTRAARCR